MNELNAVNQAREMVLLHASQNDELQMILTELQDLETAWEMITNNNNELQLTGKEK